MNSIRYILCVFASLLSFILVAQEKELPELIPYRKGNKMGFCDKNKNIVINCTFDEAYPFSEGLARVKKSNQWGFINEKGETVIPCKFDFAFDFKEGFAVVKKKSKYGFINQKGELITPLKYEFAWSFNGGLAGVGYEDFKWGFIDQKGNEVISHKRFYNIWDFMDEHEIVDLNGYWGYYSLEDGIIYDDFGLNPWSFYGDYAIVASEDFQQTIIINKKGEKISLNKIKSIFQEKKREFNENFLKFDNEYIESLIEVLNIKTPENELFPVQYYVPEKNSSPLRRTLTPEGLPAYIDMNGNQYWE